MHPHHPHTGHHRRGNRLMAARAHFAEVIADRCAARFGGPFGHAGSFAGPFAGFGDDGADGEGGPRRRRAKRFAGDALRLMVLGLLAEAPQHGYQLIRTFAARSGDAYQPSPGVLYPLLSLLADEGLVEDAEPATAGSRRSLRLTAAGSAEVAARADETAALFARLAALGSADDDVRSEAAPVRRAFHNLRATVIERLRRAARPGGEATPRDAALDIARLIDELAHAIERL